MARQLWRLFSLQFRVCRAKKLQKDLNLCGGELCKAVQSDTEERSSSTHDVQCAKDYMVDKDVFLCHSGKQKNFVRQLHRDLIRAHVSCFFDEDNKSLPLAHKFPPLIFKAAEKCKIAVVVLSKEFVVSKWPMLELSTFIRAMNAGKNANLKILPIFFKTGPKELSHITKDSPEWQNMDVSNEEKGKWQDALKEVRSIKGLHFREDEHEVNFRDNVVKEICYLLNRINPEFPKQTEAPECDIQLSVKFLKLSIMFTLSWESD